MLTNVEPFDNLYGLARSRARSYTTTTVTPRQAAQLLEEGWSLDRESTRSVRLKRDKAIGKLLEDRVWTLMHRMGFDFMSGEGGAHLAISKEPGASQSQIDIVAIDSEIALAIECKASASPGKRPQFSQELGKHTLVRDRFTAAVRSQFRLDHKRQTVLAFFFENAVLTDSDLSRAKAENVLIFRYQELSYYEQLVNHVGRAAKYQFLADMLPGKSIPGLAIRLPAIKTRMGDYTSYHFSIRADYLLKIAYISHRSKGRASDVNTYQRMLKKGRLKTIRDYILDHGIFPTNIVLNFERNRLQFERSHQETIDREGGVAGWLDLKAAYKSAWVIDGQHRLFAYSGIPDGNGMLTVVAFENLAPSQQAKMFIDINAKQKSVKQSLLMELVAELNWDADDQTVRAGAIISKAVQVLDAELTSPLYHRILMANASKDVLRCISLTSLYSVLEKANLLVRKVRTGPVYETGPLWAGSNEATLDRLVTVIEYWLGEVRIANLAWWNKGSGPGGGIAMNDGVATCINVLRSVFASLESKGLLSLDNDALVELLTPYGQALARHFASFSEQQKQHFRELRGVQGVTRRVRDCQKAIREVLPLFNPEGLDRFIEEQNSQTNLRGKEIIDRIEITLQKVVLEELKRECGQDDSGWWTVGVPKSIRVRIRQSEEEDGGKRKKEGYFNLIDYSKIASQNWLLFQRMLGRGKGGNKDAKLSWLNFVNEKRNVVSHVSSGVNLSVNDLSELEEIDSWLRHQISKSGSVEDLEDDPSTQD